MVSIVEATRVSTAPSRSRTAAACTAFDDDGRMIGPVSPCGAVTDDGGVRIGVAWPDGGVYDFTGRRIGRTQPNSGAAPQQGDEPAP